jgi:hypothetical protein
MRLFRYTENVITYGVEEYVYLKHAKVIKRY